MEFRKLGLCLSGGGGKGAYQIGVWRALRDYGLESRIAAIAGSSVGGLNGAMMAQGKYEKAEAMWLHIERHEVLTVADSPQIAGQLARMGAAGVLSPLALNVLQTQGLFKPDGLKSMIAEGLEAGRLVSSGVPLTVALHDAQANQIRYLPLQHAHLAADALQATAALPFIFEPVDIEGTTYTDGGFYWGLPGKRVDNTPIRPLVEAGCDTIIVVSLSQDDLRASPRQHPGVRLLPLVPNRSLGGALCTLDFSNQGAADRMEQGYADACHLLSHLELFLANEAQYLALWERARGGAEAEQTVRLALHGHDTRHAQTVGDIHDFDQIIARDDFTTPLGLADDDASEGPVAALDALTLQNAACLADIERQQIDRGVEKFLIDNQNNGQVLEAAVLDALSALSPVTGRADALRDQGGLARLWGTLTGGTQQLAAENDHALAQAQFASLRLIAAVQEKGAITLEFACVLQNRINGAYGEVSRLSQRQNQDLKRVYRSMAGAYTRLRGQLLDQARRLDRLEQRTQVLEWLAHPNQPRVGSQSLRELAAPLRLAALANDFFHLTAGDWRVRELHSLKEMCLQTGADAAPVRVGELLQALLEQPDTAQTLTQGLARPDAAQPVRLPAARWLVELRDNRLSPTGAVDAALACWGCSTHTELPAWDVLVDLLHHLKAAGFTPRRHGDLGEIKATWLQALDGLSGLVAEQILPAAFATEVGALRERIERFRLTVPLIGKFSAGKSTLINRWLGTELQPYDLNPCTSVATEFLYAEPGHEAFTVHHLLDAQTGQTEAQTYPLSTYAAYLDRLKTAPPEAQPLFIQVFANRRELARHPDLILVDTPGLESVNGQHERALSQYVGEGVAFILCVTRLSAVGVSELAFVNRLRALGQTFSVLVCQEALSNASEREATRRTVAEQVGLDPDQRVCGCSAVEGDLAGFEDLLAHFEAAKADLLCAVFAPGVQALVERAERLLREQLALDTQADALHARKTAIAQSLEKTQSTLAQEEAGLLRDCEGAIARQVLATVGSFLRGRRAAYAQQLLGGQSFEHVLAADARQAYQLAAAQCLTPRLKEVGQRVGRSASLQEGVQTLDLNAIGVSGLEGAGAGGAMAGAAAGAAIGSFFPVIGTLVGAALGGLAGFFLGQNHKESEASEKAASAIQAVTGQLNGMVPGALRQQAEVYLAGLRHAIEQQRHTEQQHITTIEAQLNTDAAHRQAIRRKADAALAQVGRLLPMLAALKRPAPPRISAPEAATP